MRCSNCGSNYVVKDGKVERSKKKIQRYKCNKCGKRFVDKKMSKHYKPKIVLYSITLYNKGLTLKEASKKVNKKFHVKVYPQLISNWMNEFKEICSYRRIRKKNKKKNLIFSKKFKHKQVYEFMYHKFKLEEFVNNYFQGLKKYLKNIVGRCPNELFRRESMRGSKIELMVKPKIKKKRNYACLLADLALKANKDNKKRHGEVQEFMLCNDTSTLAVEVPVWLKSEEIMEMDIFGKIDKAITGHIDIVQKRYGLIHVLDYKPNAVKEKPISQLFFYAFALSLRTGIWLRNFKCAWFDDRGYYEFSPGEIVLKNEDLDKREEKKYKLDYDKQLFYEKNMFKELKKGNPIRKFKGVMKRESKTKTKDI